MDAMINSNLMQFVPDRLGLASVPYFWNVDNIWRNGDSFEAVGWALPIDGRVGDTEIFANGHSLGAFHPIESAEVARVYPWWPNARMSGFRLTIPASLAGDEVCLVPGRGGIPMGPKFELFFRPHDMLSAFPDDVMQGRIGAQNKFQFSMAGLTLARQFKRVVESSTGKRWGDFASVADWGCGSGRVARHFLREAPAGQKFVGFDIDEPATKWAGKNTGGRFVATSTEPPLPVPSGSLDLVYAYSVFTHLQAKEATKWLREMADKLRPGGVFVFTVLSSTAMLALNPYAPDAMLDDFASPNGFDSVKNNQLDSIEVSGDYYRNVWFSLDAVKRLVSDHYHIAAVEENFHYYQDAVVCIRK